MESSKKIALPRDAGGREIPLYTKVLYNKKGEKLCIKRIEFDPFSKEWVFRLPDNLYCWNITCRPKDVYLVNPAQPDSWEKLLEDLDRGADALDYEACAYFGKSAFDCSSCIADKSETYERVVMRDIADRIRKLRGEGK